MTVYGVTGASGALGGLAARALLARGVAAADVVGLARTPSKAADLSSLGVDVREGDYDNPSTLLTALTGVDRLLLVSSSEAGHRLAHHTNVVDAARRTGVARVVYTSMLDASDSANPLAEEHRRSESMLHNSTMPFVFLRNGWYTENYIDQLDTYLSGGEIVGATDGGAISGATRDDYADAAAVVLMAEGVDGRTFELGGPAFTLAELAQTITDTAGSSVTYRDLSVVDYVADLRRHGLDDETARFVAALDESIARGELYTDSNDLAELIGHPPTGPATMIERARKGDRS